MSTGFIRERLRRLGDSLRLYHPRYRFILGLPAGSRVLDLGCGDFSAMKRLLQFRPDLEFSAVDARDVSHAAPEGVAFYRCDIQGDTLPFEESSFDAVYCSHVLEHLSSTCCISNEMRRVLKDKGCIYLETPSIRSLWIPSFRFAREQGIPFNFYDDPTHQKPFSKTGLYLFLKGIGFEEIKTGTARNPWSLLGAPLFILRGLVLRERFFLILPVWEAVGWCIYGIGNNLKK